MGLKVLVVVEFLVLAAVVFLGELWQVLVMFALLVVTLRMQRKQEAKRLHGYRRRPRRGRTHRGQ